MTKTDIQVIINYTLGWVGASMKSGNTIEEQCAVEITDSFLNGNEYMKSRLTDGRV